MHPQVSSWPRAEAARYRLHGYSQETSGGIISHFSECHLTLISGRAANGLYEHLVHHLDTAGIVRI